MSGGPTTCVQGTLSQPDDGDSRQLIGGDRPAHTHSVAEFDTMAVDREPNSRGVELGDKAADPTFGQRTQW